MSKLFFMDPADPTAVRMQEAPGCIAIGNPDDMAAKLTAAHIAGAAAAHLEPAAYKGKKRGEVCKLIFDEIQKKIASIPDAVDNPEATEDTAAAPIETKEEPFDGKAETETETTTAKEAPKATRTRRPRTVAAPDAAQVSGPSAKSQEAFFNGQLSALVNFAEASGFHWVIGRNESGETELQFEKK
jgi:hypothetical protein